MHKIFIDVVFKSISFHKYVPLMQCIQNNNQDICNRLSLITKPYKFRSLYYFPGNAQSGRQRPKRYMHNEKENETLWKNDQTNLEHPNCNKALKALRIIYPTMKSKGIKLQFFILESITLVWSLIQYKWKYKMKLFLVSF